MEVWSVEVRGSLSGRRRVLRLAYLAGEADPVMLDGSVAPGLLDDRQNEFFGELRERLAAARGGASPMSAAEEHAARVEAAAVGFREHAEAVRQEHARRAPAPGHLSTGRERIALEHEAMRSGRHGR